MLKFAVIHYYFPQLKHVSHPKFQRALPVKLITPCLMGDGVYFWFVCRVITIMIKIYCGRYHFHPCWFTLFWELCSACIIKLMRSSESYNKVIRTDRSISRSFIYLKCMVPTILISNSWLICFNDWQLYFSGFGSL